MKSCHVLKNGTGPLLLGVKMGGGSKERGRRRRGRERGSGAAGNKGACERGAQGAHAGGNVRGDGRGLGAWLHGAERREGVVR